MHICLNDRVKQKIRKLSVTIQRSCNCVELLRFTTCRTTLCKCSEYPGNYKINNLNFVENADRIFLSVLFIVAVSFYNQETFYRRSKPTAPNRSFDNQCIVFIDIFDLCNQCRTNIIIQFLPGTCCNFIIYRRIRFFDFYFYNVAARQFLNSICYGTSISTPREIDNQHFACFRCWAVRHRYFFC